MIISQRIKGGKGYVLIIYGLMEKRRITILEMCLVYGLFRDTCVMAEY